MAYVLAALAALVLYFILSSIASWYRLRQFRGPLLGSFSYLWMARTTLSGKSWRIHMDVNEKYGEPLIRIGPDVLITDDPEIIRRMGAARSPYKRDKWYTSFRTDPYVHSMISTDDDIYHQDLKSKTAAAYSGKDVPTREADVDSQIENFKDLIRTKYLSTPALTKPMDLGAGIQYYTLDAITKVALGKEWGFLASDSDVDALGKSFADVGPFLSLCCDVPLARNIFFNDFMLQAMGPKHTDATGFGKMMGIMKKAVDQRFDQDEELNKPDMLGSFIRNGISRRQCESELALAVLAGSDTTAGVVRGTLLYLMTAPLIYKRLQGEIDEAVASNRVSSPISQAQAKSYPYLQAVILEGMRLHPPNNILLNKLVPPEGDTLQGRFVPGGTKIAWNVWSLLRHKPTFGDDAYLFRPERWLEVGPDRRLEMERHVDLIFGYGRYACAGKSVAILELNKIYFELLRDFDFQLINPKTPWSETMYTVFVIRDMWVRVTNRSK